MEDDVRKRNFDLRFRLLPGDRERLRAFVEAKRRGEDTLDPLESADLGCKLALLVAGCFALGLFMYGLSKADPHPFYFIACRSLWSTGVVIIVFKFIAPAVAHARLRLLERLLRDGSPQYVMRIADGGVETVTGTATEIIKWEDISEVDSDRHGVYLCQREDDWRIIPRRAFLSNLDVESWQATVKLFAMKAEEGVSVWPPIPMSSE